MKGIACHFDQCWRCRDDCSCFCHRAPTLLVFVDALMKDWVADQWLIFDQFGVGGDEHAEMEAEIAKREAEWERIRASINRCAL